MAIIYSQGSIIMQERLLSLVIISIALLSPTLATHVLYGVNDTLAFSYGAFDQALVLNGSLVCTATNGLCVTNISGLNAGYNTSDSTWIYNGSSGLTSNQTTLNATYQKKLSGNCTGDDYVNGVNADGSMICDTPTDTNTMYSASGLLLQLGATVFSVKEGNMTNGGICKYNSTIGLWCNETISFTDTNCNATNSCPTIVYSNNGSWVKLNQYTYNNLSITDITSAIGNATLQYTNSSLWSADKAAVVANASRYYGSNLSLLTDQNGTYIATTCSNANGNYSAVQSLLYTNISTALGFYSNASRGASYYANSSLGASLYTNASTYPAVSGALYTNITGINTTSSIQKLLALSNITVTNITLSEAGHTLKSYWNGTMWVTDAT
jgi:hypothetical protein